MTSPDTATSPSAAAAEDVTVANRPRAARPVTVAGCVILEELGRGGMGVVYKARQTALNRVVAVKVLSADGSKGESALRFRLEAETIARLSHPGIVGIYEIGDADGRPFYVLEYAAGGSLDARLDAGPMPAREAAALVEKVARAVDAAHRAGVVHRDIKPANVLLTESGEPKVSDFGLAKRLDSGEGLTRTGEVMGTPSYMAPEQAAGHAALVGPATDVYGLGAVLYSCLAGRPPFSTGSVMKTLDEVRNKPPAPLRRLDPKIPRDLETIAAKCLHKEPSRRYATAAELADDLARYLKGEPIRARPVGLAERLFSAIRRRPTAAAAWVLGLIAAALGAVTLLVADANRVASRAKDAAEEAREVAAAVNDVNQVRLGLRMALAGDREGGRAALAGHREKGRGWEWHLIDRLLHSPHEFDAGDGAVYALHFTRDGRDLIVGTESQALRRFAVAAGKPTLDFPGSGKPPRPPDAPRINPDTPYETALSDDGRTLYSAAKGRGVNEWDVDTGKPRRETWLNTMHPLTSAAFHPKKRHVVGGHAGIPVFGGATAVYDMDTGKVVAVAEGHAGPVTTVDYSVRQERLVSGCEFGEVRVFDTINYKCLATHKSHFGPVRSVRTRPGRAEYVSGGADGIVFRYAFHDGRLLSNLSVGKIISFMAWSHNGSLLAVGRADGAVVVWNPERNATFDIPPPDARGSAVTAIAFRRDDGAIAVGHQTGLVRVVPSLPPATHESFTRGDGNVETFDPDSGLSLSRTADHKPALFRREGGRLSLVRTYEHAPGGTPGLALHAPSKTVALAGHDPFVHLRDLGTGFLRETVALPAGGFPIVAFSPDGRRLIHSSHLGNGRTRVGVYRVGSGEKMTFREFDGANPRVTFSADGALAAVVTTQAVTLVRAGDLSDVWTSPEGHLHAVAAVFAPDGRTLAVAGMGYITVYPIDRPEAGRRLRANQLHDVAFSPDGSRLLTLHPHGVLGVWDPARGEELFSARVAVGGPIRLAWGEDGRALYLFGQTPVVHVVRAERAALPPFVAK